MTFPATLILKSGKKVSLTVSRCALSFGRRTKSESDDFRKTAHPVRVVLDVDPIHDVDSALLKDLAETFKLWEDKEARRLDEISIDMPDGMGTIVMRLLGFSYDPLGGAVHLSWADEGQWVPR